MQLTLLKQNNRLNTYYIRGEWGKMSQQVSWDTTCILATIHNACHETLTLGCILHFHLAVEEIHFHLAVEDEVVSIFFAFQSYFLAYQI